MSGHTAAMVAFLKALEEGRIPEADDLRRRGGVFAFVVVEPDGDGSVTLEMQTHPKIDPRALQGLLEKLLDTLEEQQRLDGAKRGAIQ